MPLLRGAPHQKGFIRHAGCDNKRNQRELTFGSLRHKALKIILRQEKIKSFPSAPVLCWGWLQHRISQGALAHSQCKHTLPQQPAAARDIRKGGDDDDGWIYRNAGALHRRTKSYSGGQQLDYLYIQTCAPPPNPFCSCLWFYIKSEISPGLLAPARKVNRHTSLCVWGQLKCISPPSSVGPNRLLLHQIGPRTQLMEACRLSEITANISSCARRPGHCAHAQARACTWGNQIANYNIICTWLLRRVKKRCT